MDSKRTTLVGATLLLAALLVACGTAEPTQSPAVDTARSTPVKVGSGLVATLEAPASLPSGAVVNVSFTLTNASSEGLYVLNWFTPLEGLAGDIFQVQRDGVSLPYRGIQVKRSEPTPDGYTWIDAGGSVSVEVDLAEGYDFAEPGEYTVQFRSPRLSHIAATSEEQVNSFEALGEVQIPSNTITVTIEQ